MLRVWIFLAVLFAGLLFAAWTSDFVTMQGERTIYTVDCTAGGWQGDRCTGRVVAGARYRYRALKPHREVIFWTLGTRDRSGKFENCEIRDGRNWVCQPSPDAARSITLQMVEGRPVPGAQTMTFRAVTKWRWLLLQRGFTNDAAVEPPAPPVSS